MCRVMYYERLLNNQKFSSALLWVNMRNRTCANNYFYLFLLSACCSSLLASSVRQGSDLNLENHGKINIFHFSNDVTQDSWLSKGHRTRSLNKEASMFCSGEAAVDSDFSLFRHNMCSRQILRLHKLMSQLVIIFPHHFFFSYCLLYKIKSFVFNHKCLL